MAAIIKDSTVIDNYIEVMNTSSWKSIMRVAEMKICIFFHLPKNGSYTAKSDGSDESCTCDKYFNLGSSRDILWLFLYLPFCPI